MADKFGSYDVAFYVCGSVVIMGAAIPSMLLFVKRREAFHEDEKGQELCHKPSKRLIMKSSSQDGDLLSCDNMATNFNVKEANQQPPCDDFTGTVIDTSLRVRVNELPCVEVNSCRGNKSVEDENNASLPPDDGGNASYSAVGGLVNKSFTFSDETITNNAEIRETSCHFTTPEVEVEVNSLLSSSTMKDNKQETTQELEYDTQM